MSERRLSGIAALLAAELTPLKVQPGERHTEFVKRIVNAYLNAVEMLEEEPERTVRERPANCRNRLRDEGRAYPKSGCAVCKDGGLRGCPYEGRPSPTETTISKGRQNEP
jgi:collagenase-like PrtC family protease